MCQTKPTFLPFHSDTLRKAKKNLFDMPIPSVALVALVVVVALVVAVAVVRVNLVVLAETVTHIYV